MKRSRAIGILLVFVLTACAPADSQSSTYYLSEFAVEGPVKLTEGSSSVTVGNTGEFSHTLVVARSDGTVVSATDLIPPGETVTLDLDLGSGSYQFTCRIVSQKPDGEIVDHFEEGMVAEVLVES